MKTKIMVLTLFVLMSAGFLNAQDRTITGKVTAYADGAPLPGVNVTLKGTATGTITDAQGSYLISVPPKGGVLVFSFVGFKTKEEQVSISNRIDVTLEEDVTMLQEVISGKAVGIKLRGISTVGSQYKRMKTSDSALGAPMQYEMAMPDWQQPAHNTEEYDGISENIFHEAIRNPLSTFSIDVDAASYSNMRRFIQQGQRPPKDAVRIEELINYFDYQYAQPVGDDPFSIYTELSAAPWNEKHHLVHIGLQGKNIPKDDLPPSNLVFLIDVSGSMDDPNKLPLLKSSFKLLVEQLRPQDRIAIVVYAGAAGLVLPPTSGSEKRKIIEALENLQAGGSTAGGAGIQLAYATAKESFNREGNNRVVLATDGDFNVGESSNAAMERLIEEKRKEGVFLTVLGFGMGNYKDSKMETLADKGNGNYMYIDSILEAQKALVNEFGGTLFTIAKDVKLQIEFNPELVRAYRLIGYENRMLKSEDFNNDRKDAGELGSGHSVTALYEIIPVGVEGEFTKIDPLKYQSNPSRKTDIKMNEVMTIKFRYKKPNEESSKLISHVVINKRISASATSENFNWSAAVAAFGMIIRESEFANNFTLEQTYHLAQRAKGIDKDGYRIEFINMIKSVDLLARK